MKIDLNRADKLNPIGGNCLTKLKCNIWSLHKYQNLTRHFQASLRLLTSFFIDFNVSIVRPRNRLSCTLKSVSYGHVRNVSTALPVYFYIHFLKSPNHRTDVCACFLQFYGHQNLTHFIDIAMYFLNMNVLISVWEINVPRETHGDLLLDKSSKLI